MVKKCILYTHHQISSKNSAILCIITQASNSIFKSPDRDQLLMPVVDFCFSFEEALLLYFAADYCRIILPASRIAVARIFQLYTRMPYSLQWTLTSLPPKIRHFLANYL